MGLTGSNLIHVCCFKSKCQLASLSIHQNSMFVDLTPPRSIHWLKSRKSGRPTQAFASLQILQPQFCWTTEGKRNITNQNTLSHPFAFTVWAAKKVLWWKKNPAKAASRESQGNVKLIIANIWLYKMLISFSSPMLMMRVNKAYPRRIYLKEPGELRMTWELWEM